MKRESKFGVFFRHWILANPPELSSVYELKQTLSDSIPFESLQVHQIDALLASKWGKKGLLYKAPDDSRGVKPYDYFYIKNAPAFVVIKYPSGFVLIDIDTFILEKERSKRKSLLWSRAREIAWKTILSKKDP